MGPGLPPFCPPASGAQDIDFAREEMRVKSFEGKQPPGVFTPAVFAEAGFYLPDQQAPYSHNLGGGGKRSLARLQQEVPLATLPTPRGIAEMQTWLADQLLLSAAAEAQCAEEQAA